MIVCIYEDRLAFAPSVKLLLLSLFANSADLRIHLFFPAASDEFLAWLEPHRNVTLYQTAVTSGSSYNVKPQTILYLMDNGHDDILWIDSDILILQSITRIFDGLDRSTFVATEEAVSGRYKEYDGKRTQLWGLEVGRTLPFALNSGIIRATTAHRAMLEHWREMLESAPYKEAQSMDWQTRPWHMLSDQDSLTALVSAREYSNIPLRLLKRGRDIIQYFGNRGYTVYERAYNIFGRKPTFVHSQGPKPWVVEWKDVPITEIGSFLRTTYNDVSPYTLHALRYRRMLTGDTNWMLAHSPLAAFLRVTGLWYPPLVGLPLALLWDAKEVIKSSRAAWRRKR